MAVLEAAENLKKSGSLQNTALNLPDFVSEVGDVAEKAFDALTGDLSNASKVVGNATGVTNKAGQIDPTFSLSRLVSEFYYVHA